MKKENIISFIETKEQEHRNALREVKEEKAKTAAKLAELEEIQAAGADNLEKYKETAQEVRDTREYLAFLTAKEKAAGGGMNNLLSDEEAREIGGIIRGDFERLQENAAPEIENALFALVTALKNYAGEYDKLKALETRANRISARPVCAIYQNEINNRFEDPEGFNIAMLQSFFKQYLYVKDLRRAAEMRKRRLDAANKATEKETEPGGGFWEKLQSGLL